MDTSDSYIKLCEKAKGIQGTNGGSISAHKAHRGNYDVALLYGNGCDDWENCFTCPFHDCRWRECSWRHDYANKNEVRIM